METITLMQGLGILGFIGYLGGFAGLQAGLICGNGRLYCIVNVVSAALVLVSLMEAFNLASALIQVSWIVIGLGGLALKVFSKKSQAESADQTRSPQTQSA